MLRRTLWCFNMWAMERFPFRFPKSDGPAPKEAPQPMNMTRGSPNLDPVENSFPTTIRGNMMQPDVPADQYTDSWFVCYPTRLNGGELKPWSSIAPHGSFRFRPFPELDKKGRDFVEKIRKYPKSVTSNTFRNKGGDSFPFREALLTRMNDVKQQEFPSSHTILARELKMLMNSVGYKGPLEVQRDVGRIEQPPNCAGKIKVNPRFFPFSWKTEDWYEYDIASARAKRFNFENFDGSSNESSEVTYKIILEADWDHIAEKLAEDVLDFCREVGRQMIEEKLASVRSQLLSLDSPNLSLDPDIVKTFKSAEVGGFGGPDCYASEEVAQFINRELRVLESQCLSAINRSNASNVAVKNNYDPNIAWPHIEHLEPWKRMLEFWTSAADNTYTEMEKSTRHYELRKFFRIVKVKMPFQSMEFEKRMYDMRHWLHRRCTAEFQTVFRCNIVYDESVFPVEHDPLYKSDHEHHRLLSYAFDWQSAPYDMLHEESVRQGDTWETVAERLGCSVQSLTLANDRSLESSLPLKVVVPRSSTNRVTATSGVTDYLSLPEHKVTNWEQAAKLLQCGVDELQAANGHAVGTYNWKNDTFADEITLLRVPVAIIQSSSEANFSTIEPVFAADTTLTAISERLGCPIDDLKKINPGLTNDKLMAGVVNEVVVPSSSKFKRRLTDPLLQPEAATSSLFPSLEQEAKQYGLQKSLPRLPAKGDQFPHELMDTSTSRYPVVPQKVLPQDSWVSFTKKYLDPDLSVSLEAEATYSLNKLWPYQQVPGRIDQTPFEEDQTWMLHRIPVQQREMYHPEGYLQDLPIVNNEHLPKSLEWTSP